MLALQLLGIAKGLAYLHQQSIIHGDLKGVSALFYAADNNHLENEHFKANIVVDKAGNPLLVDFGLSSITIGPTSIVSTSSAKGGGTVRWMAPELCDPDRTDHAASSTTQSDIFSFAMVVVEIFTGRKFVIVSRQVSLTILLPDPGAHPFDDISRSEKVSLKVLRGDRPARPQNSDIRGLTDDVWGVVEKCWVKEPESRLRADQVVADLETAAIAFDSHSFVDDTNERPESHASTTTPLSLPPPPVAVNPASVYILFYFTRAQHLLQSNAVPKGKTKQAVVVVVLYSDREYFSTC